MYRFIILIAIAFVFVSCKSKKPQEIEASNRPNQTSDLNQDLVEKIFYNVPSPIEMASMAKKAGLVFDRSLMNPVENKQKYISQNNQALNLGVYGADLSYSRVFDQVQESINYLSVIRELTEDLQIPQSDGAFAIDKLEENLSNRDSLLRVITEIYSNVDVYLKENDREVVASMIITGGWVEANYLVLNSVNLDSPDKEVVQRIGEQRMSLESLIELNQVMVDQDKRVGLILNDLKALQEIFQDVEITTSDVTVSTDNEAGRSVIGGSTVVEISTTTLKQLHSKITQIRNSFTTP